MAGTERTDFSLCPRRGARLFFLGLVLVATMVAAAGTGAVAVPPGEIIRIVLGKILLKKFGVGDIAPLHESIVMAARLPRVLLAALVGGGLAAAGVVLQALFRNPLADPYLIGASSGAALGGCVAILTFPGATVGPFSTLPVFAFAGALGAVVLVFGLAREASGLVVERLLLAGIAVGSSLGALVSLLVFLSGDRLHPLIYWLLGSLSARNWGHVAMALPYTLGALFMALLFVRELNGLLLGEEEARYLGIEVEKVKKALLAAAALLTATAVAAAGPVGFVGLIIPHITRQFLGADHRILLPGAVLAGAAFLVGADLVARTIIAPGEMPVGIITAACGGPFFAYLLWRRRRAF